MAEPTVSGLFNSLQETAKGSVEKAGESAKSAAMSHVGKIGEEFGILKKKIPFSITKNNDAEKNNDADAPVEEVKPAAAPAAGGRRRSRRKSKKSKKRKTSRRGRKSKKRVRFSRRK